MEKKKQKHDTFLIIRVSSLEKNKLISQCSLSACYLTYLAEFHRVWNWVTPFTKSTCICAVPAATNISGLFALRAYLKKQPNLEQTLLFKR